MEMSGQTPHNPSNPHRLPGGEPIGAPSASSAEAQRELAIDALLDTLLRQPVLPEPPQWFAARTLARLRNDLRARPLSLGLRLWFDRWSLHRLASRPLLATACSLLVLLGIAGFHLKAERDNQQLTFDALALAAQGEAPFNDEETTWPDGAF